MKKNLFYVTTALFGASALMPAVAQIDEIVVTATKREQTLQEVPIAVSVVQEETLEAAQIVDVIDLQSIVPSLRVSQLERASNTTFTIRGFGNGANNPGIEPSVAVFVDGVFRTRVGSALNDFINLERIEVLKGPQSTLFGKNASAGVVSIVTKKPEYELSGAVEATIGNFNSRILKGFVTGPVNDIVAVSLSGSMNKRDGYFENIGDTDSYNDRDRFSLRGQVLAQPTDNLEFRFIADYDEINEVCCGTARVTDGTGDLIRALGGETAPVGDNFSYVIAQDFQNDNRIINKGISGEMTWDINEDNTLTYVGSYRYYDDNVDYEGDFTTIDLLGSNVRALQTDTITQEVRLVGEKGRFNYLVGGFYFNEDMVVDDTRLYGVDARDYVDFLSGGALAGLEAAFGLPVNATYYQNGGGTVFQATQDDTQFQFFTQIDFQVTDRLTLTGGISYFQADKEIDFTNVQRTNPFSDVNLVEVGFGDLFAGTTGLAPTPENIGLVATTSPDVFAALQTASITTNADALAAGGVDAGGVVVDPVTGIPAANPFLDFFALGLQPLGPLTPFPNSVENGETSDDDTPYTLRAAYDLTDRSNIYLSYATGFKASSWNLTPDTRPFASDLDALLASGELAADGAFGVGPVVNTALALQLATGDPFYTGTRFAGPETTKTLEFGLKSRFSFGSLNLAIFDQTVEGFQSATFQGTGFVLANAGEQSVLGFEFDALLQPPQIEGLSFNISGLYMDAEYDDYVGAPVVPGSEADLRDGAADGIGDLSGEQPAAFPEFSGSFGVDYRRPLADMGEWFVRADYQYESEVAIIDNVPESDVSRQVGMLNASLGANFDNGVEVLVWGRNINEDEFFTSGFPTTLQPGSFTAYPNVPRTYGFTVRKRF